MVRSRKSAILRWTIVTGLLAGGVAYFLVRGAPNEAPVSFRTARIDRGAVEETVTATGAVNAVVTVQVGTQVSGTILKLFADFNSRVKEGQIIAQIDPTRFRANVAQAEASLKTAEANRLRAKVNAGLAKLDLDRARDLKERAVVGQAELDTAVSRHDQALAELAAGEAQVAQARASVGVARVDLERTTIRAPISGTVLQRAVDVGQTVAASLQAPTLFTIAQDLSQMEVRAAVDEADVGKLREGQDARFTVDAYPGEDFRATIYQVRSQPNVQQNVVSYDAILRVANPDAKLRPGMTATVRVVSQRRENVVRVPNAAIRFKPAPELIEMPDRSGPGKGAALAGDVPAGSRGPEQRKRADGVSAASRQGRGEGAGPGGRPGVAMAEGAPGGPPASGGRAMARVFRAKGNKLVAVHFKPGIADDEHTEVLSGPLAEGEEIVVDATGGPQRSQAPPGGNPMRGRGPRFF